MEHSTSLGGGGGGGGGGTFHGGKLVCILTLILCIALCIPSVFCL